MLSCEHSVGEASRQTRQNLFSNSCQQKNRNSNQDWGKKVRKEWRLGENIG